MNKKADASRIKVDDNPKEDEAEAVAKELEHREALDLSIPLQPKIEFGSLQGHRSLTERLLPDLFEPAEQLDERSLHQKGRILVPQTRQHDRDSIEGGQITIEMKTR